ncbi:MAG TPA: hypothetical protein VFD92_04870 [Candidatus Binatia bacterium]|nr:hypothetical protein [Candidatus Binatia bacterium]
MTQAEAIELLNRGIRAMPSGLTDEELFDWLDEHVCSDCLRAACAALDAKCDLGETDPFACAEVFSAAIESATALGGLELTRG